MDTLCGRPINNLSKEGEYVTAIEGVLNAADIDLLGTDFTQLSFVYFAFSLKRKRD